MGKEIYTHPTAIVEEGAQVGSGTRIYHFSHIREGAEIGEECVIGGHVYIDTGVKIGARCKIQSGARLFHGVTLESGVFVGPGAQLANDKFPRSINPDGSLKTAEDWEVLKTHVKYGASIGMGALIGPGLTIGQWAMIGMGAVVVKDVPDFGLVVGNPARLIGFVDKDGRPKK